MILLVPKNVGIRKRRCSQQSATMCLYTEHRNHSSRLHIWVPPFSARQTSRALCPKTLPPNGLQLNQPPPLCVGHCQSPHFYPSTVNHLELVVIGATVCGIVYLQTPLNGRQWLNHSTNPTDTLIVGVAKCATLSMYMYTYHTSGRSLLLPAEDWYYSHPAFARYNNHRM